MKTQVKRGGAQLDGRSFITKANFLVHNFCSLFALMMTYNAFILTATIPHKFLKVNDESQHWEDICSEESIKRQEARPNCEHENNNPLLCAIKYQTSVQLTQKGTKDTAANICYIGFKCDYYHNLKDPMISVWFH